MSKDRYIARLKHPFAEVEPITKEVTEKLESNPETTIKDLIHYLVKDNGFNDDEKNIANSVNEMLTRCNAFLENPQTTGIEILAIRALDEEGNQREFDNGYLERDDVEPKKYLNPNARALDGNPFFFEERSIDSQKYKGLDIEVATQGLGGYK
ncbi:hypothetical protein HN419_06075 [Candidatus Woesearchaeota archaeon]|jgi:hypothetical protein|nr:hypothetical protein [Candidatus Woesearchaeota archaeon]MBT3537562.1 hypothetical protein [Candidatus Woesearchaeota archaeon]MBT4698378.1 hypothetical protein [Candidatus Woesearchaeota archaeon]MBT4716535.1 hypothetical protein [Candidatus Woesearchaeota archaeon]MBT7105231.1 hypothetical protein [Candidatus Woesearchaeota archaeon]